MVNKKGRKLAVNSGSKGSSNCQGFRELSLFITGQEDGKLLPDVSEGQNLLDYTWLVWEFRKEK